MTIMTNQQGAPEALRPIARYKIGYATDDWGVRSSTPSGIPDPAGAWVRYEDHIAALVDAQQVAPSAAVALSDDLRDRLVAISGAVADQDDRAAQAMLREILAAPQPSPTAQTDSAPAWASQAVIEYRYTGGTHWCPLGPAERMKPNFDGVYRLQGGVFPVEAPADSQPAPVLDYPPLPRVGAIGYASVVDIESYAKTLTIGPHLPGVRDIALWTTDQMRAYVDADRAARALATPPTQAVEELIRLKAQAKQDKELILQLVETLASVDAAMPFPVARQVLKVARARLEQLNHH